LSVTLICTPPLGFDLDHDLLSVLFEVSQACFAVAQEIDQDLQDLCFFNDDFRTSRTRTSSHAVPGEAAAVHAQCIVDQILTASLSGTPTSLE